MPRKRPSYQSKIANGAAQPAFRALRELRLSNSVARSTREDIKSASSTQTSGQGQSTPCWGWNFLLRRWADAVDDRAFVGGGRGGDRLPGTPSLRAQRVQRKRGVRLTVGCLERRR